METTNPTNTDTAATVDSFSGPLERPFRYLGLETTDDRARKNGDRERSGQSYTTNLCGGSCDLCGTAIWNVYLFEDSNGKRFKTGCDCAEKHLRPEEVSQAKRDARAHKSAQRKAAAAKRKARDAARIIAAFAKLDAASEALSAKPHPHPRMEGTLLDWVQWMRTGAGQAGKLKAAIEIEKVL